MTNWEPFDERIRELEAKRSVSENRRSVFEVIKASQLLPNPEFPPSLYLGPLIDLDGKPLCLEYTNDHPNLWFHTDHADKLRAAGFTLERKPPSSTDSEGRHAGLKGKGFRDVDAWKLGNLDADMTLAALTALGLTGARGNGQSIPRFSRAEIEAAMEAYDGFRVGKGGTDKDFF